MQFGIALKPDISVERIVGADAPGRSRWIRVRLDFRFSRAVERTLSFAHADGDEHEADAIWAHALRIPRLAT